MLRILPDKQELMRIALPYSLAVLAIILALWMGSGGEVSMVESTRFIKQVEVKEVVKYVEVNKTDNRRVEITKPDGTRIVSTHDTQMGRTESSVETVKKESEQKEELKEERKIAGAKYNLGVSIDVNGDFGISAGARLGGLPLFLQLYALPTKLYGAVGLQLEL